MEWKKIMHYSKIEAVRHTGPSLSKAQIGAVESIASRLGVDRVKLLACVLAGGISFSDLTWRAYGDSEERGLLTCEFINSLAAA